MLRVRYNVYFNNKGWGVFWEQFVKWLFDKVNFDSLPCAATPTNMIDTAHVLSKLQVAEGMINTERWDLHGDGTSRDGKQNNRTTGNF